MALTSLTNLQPLHVHSVGISTFDGSVSVGGTLTYEDVTNVDAIGIITARTGVNVSGGQLDVGSNIKLGNAGVITATSFVGSGANLTGITQTTINNAADNRVLTATGTANTLNAESNVHIDGSGRLMVGTTTEGREQADDLTVATSGTTGITIRSGSSNDGNIYFSDGTSGAAEYQGIMQYNHANYELRFYTSGVQCSKFNSSGHVEPGTDSTFDLGTGSNRFRNIYADTLYGDGSNLTGISGVTINNNANNRLITGSGTANTLEGESTLTFDGTQLRVNAGAGSNVQTDGSGSYGQFAGVKVWMGAGSRSHNTAVGNGALNSANGGDDCTAVGHNAYANGTSGEDNTVVGSHAMDDNVTGHKNCAFGHASLSALTSGYNNSCYGRTSGFAMLNGHNNTFLGYDAGYNTTSGSYNIFAGSGAGKYETTSTDNVAIGYHCFGAERSGGNSNQFNKNVVVGHQALAQQRISNGDGENVCIGYRAMYNTTTSSWRTVVIGFEAGYNNNGGSYNTFVGTYAGKNYTSGGNTMCLGYNAGTANSPSGNLTNQQDVICLGNNVTSQLYCNDTSISSSDSRDKTDITEWTHGLSFINQLKPVTYRWDKRTWYGTDEEPIGTPDGSKKKAKLHLGFLAQDALAVEQSFGYASKKDDMLAVNLNEDETAYGMKYERLVVPLTKAVQELSAEVDKLKAEIAVLKGS